MMKKLSKVVTIALILALIIIPGAESAKASGETLGYYEEKLAQFRAEAQANTNAINNTDTINRTVSNIIKPPVRKKLYHICLKMATYFPK